MIDRVVIREGVRSRIAESIKLAVRQGDGLVLASLRGETPRRERLARPALQHAVCLSGLQNQLRGAGAADLQLQQPLWRLPGVRRAGVARGVRSRTWSCPTRNFRWPTGPSPPGKTPARPRLRKQKTALGEFMTAAGIRWNTPLAKLEGQDLPAVAARRRQRFPRLLAMLEKEYQPTASQAKRQRLETFRGEERLPGVPRRAAAGRGPRGARGRHGHPRDHGHDGAGRRGILRGVLPTEPRGPSEQADRPTRLHEINARLEFLDAVGLDYLTLDRPADTLSGGELQRVRLASGPGLRPGRRLLRARRALDRPAPPRQSSG